MRNHNERVQATLRGAKKIQKKQKVRRMEVILGSISLCLVLFFSVSVPGLVQNVNFASNTAELAGSIFADSQLLHYIIIGLVSFILGVAFTTFCVILHRKNRENEDDS